MLQEVLTVVESVDGGGKKFSRRAKISHVFDDHAATRGATVKMS
jgi:hypothetical protein